MPPEVVDEVDSEVDEEVDVVVSNNEISDRPQRSLVSSSPTDRIKRSLPLQRLDRSSTPSNPRCSAH